MGRLVLSDPLCDLLFLGLISRSGESKVRVLLTINGEIRLYKRYTRYCIPTTKIKKKRESNVRVHSTINEEIKFNENILGIVYQQR